MARPPVGPRTAPLVDQPSWRSVLGTCAVMAALPLLLWALTDPLVSVVLLAAVGGAAIGTRGAVRLVRCFYDCGGFSVHVGGRVRIAVSRPETGNT